MRDDHRGDRDDDGGFAAYAAARWAPLVRVGVLLGAPVADARELARATLTRCAPGWERARRESDVDAWIYAVLLEQWLHLPLEAHDREDPEPDLVHPDPERSREALAGTLAHLRALTPDQRTATVLHQVAGFDEDVAAGLTGGSRPRPVPVPDDLLVDALAALPVGPAPVEEVLADVAATHRRRRTIGVVAVAVLAVVTALAVWLPGDDDGPPPPPAPEVVRADNPANLTWYANGELHVARAVVTVPGVTGLVDVRDGAVYTDDGGDVVLVSDDGEVEKIGEHPPGDPVAGSDERGWVTWTEGTSRGLDLVVYDTRSHREIGRHVLDAEPGDTADDGVEPIAVDQEFVYYRDRRGQWKWQPGTGGAAEVVGPPLLDVAAAVRVSEVGPGRFSALQPLFDVEITMAGEGALLSPDGRFVITRLDEPQPGTVVVYDVRDGSRVPSGLGRDDLALAAAFGPDGSASYVVAHRPNAPVGTQDLRLSTSGPHLLRTCVVGNPYLQPDEPQCRTVTQFAANSAMPLLPG